MKNICDWNKCTKEGLYKAPTLMFRSCKGV